MVPCWENYQNNTVRLYLEDKARKGTQTKNPDLNFISRDMWTGGYPHKNPFCSDLFSLSETARVVRIEVCSKWICFERTQGSNWLFGAV
jgi:hypothetical protein